MGPNPHLQQVAFMRRSAEANHVLFVNQRYVTLKIRFFMNIDCTPLPFSHLREHSAGLRLVRSDSESGYLNFMIPLAPRGSDSWSLFMGSQWDPPIFPN